MGASSMIPWIIDSPTAQSWPTAAIESTSATSAEPVTTTATVATATTVLLTVGVVVPSAIALIVVMVTTLIVCVYCKKYLKYKRFHSGVSYNNIIVYTMKFSISYVPASILDTAELLPKLLENPAYSMVSQNHGTILQLFHTCTGSYIKFYSHDRESADAARLH